MIPAPGTRLGPYEIQSALGAGGMGEVYRARDTRLKREVALKILPESFASDPDRLARFQREAEVLASLNHPNIAAIHGLEESDGISALVMELVEGETLADRVARGPVPIDEALPIAKQIAEALEAAHEQGIIHRDLKPANIKITPNGDVKVLDFGLAKLTEAPIGSARGPSPQSMSPTITSPAMMTGIGVLLGTAAYMSPEQAKGRPADKRSDIWAFGCVLYEILTGRRAFAGDDVADTLAFILTKEADWTALPASTPASIRRLLRRCLEKERKRRLADTGDVQLEVDEALAEPTHETSTRRPPPSSSTSWWRRPLVLGPAGLVLGALLAGFAVWSFRPPSDSMATRFAFTLPEGQQFTNTGRSLVAISPDGTELVYVANNRLYIRTISEFEARVIPGTEIKEGIANPVFSPDNRSIAFFSNGDRTIKRVSVSGGPAVTICPATLPYGMSWGTDGIVIGQGEAGILRVSPNGGKPERLVSVQKDERAHGPQILPSGLAVLFTLSKGESAADPWDEAQVVVQSLASGARKTLIDGGTDARYLPTGHLVYAVGGNILAVPFDPDRQEVTGGPVAVLEGVRRAAGAATGTAQLSVSNTGSLMYVVGPAVARTDNTRSIVLADRNGETTLLSVPPRAYVHPRVSRDGARLAVGSDDGNEAIVWIYDLAGTNAIRRLTFGGHNRFPIWSGDGQRVVFQSDREDDAAIFWQRADGTGPAERLTKPEQGTSHVPESWSPDGKRLLFTVTKNATFSLWTLSLEDKTAAPFGDVQSREPISAVFSPDGRWIAYGSNLLGRGDSPNVGVYVQPFPATGARYQVPKVGRDFHPLWAPDGKELFFVPSSSRFAGVSVTTQPSFVFGNPVNLPSATQNNRISTDVRSYDILPDGKFVGLVAGSGADLSKAIAAPEIRVVVNWFEELKRLVPTK